jgi:hypothetical protein
MNNICLSSTYYQLDNQLKDSESDSRNYLNHFNDTAINKDNYKSYDLVKKAMPIYNIKQIIKIYAY